jgi:hypothetical protein
VKELQSHTSPKKIDPNAKPRRKKKPGKTPEKVLQYSSSI